FLSPPRQPATADSAVVRRSLATLRVLAQAAGQAREPVAETIDYRDVPVVVAVRRVSPTGCTLALKVDRSEVLAEFERSGRLAGAAAAFLLLALAGFPVALPRERQRARLLPEPVRRGRAMVHLAGLPQPHVA